MHKRDVLTWGTAFPWLPPTDLSIKYGNLIYPKNVIQRTYPKGKWHLIFPASFSRHIVFSALPSFFLIYFIVDLPLPPHPPFSPLVFRSSLLSQSFSRPISSLMIRSIFNARSTFRTGARLSTAANFPPFFSCCENPEEKCAAFVRRV